MSAYYRLMTMHLPPYDRRIDWPFNRLRTAHRVILKQAPLPVPTPTPARWVPFCEDCGIWYKTKGTAMTHLYESMKLERVK